MLEARTEQLREVAEGAPGPRLQQMRGKELDAGVTSCRIWSKLTKFSRAPGKMAERAPPSRLVKGMTVTGLLSMRLGSRQ